MKLQSYRLLFRLFSYLSDRTNGGSFFVKYKLLLGTLIIGLAGAACGKPKQVLDDDKTTRSNDSFTAKDKKQNIVDLDQGDHLIDVTCYLPVPLSPEIDTEIPLVVVGESEKAKYLIYPLGMTDVPPIWQEKEIGQFREWVESNIRYSKNMLKEKIEGRLVASFVIDEEGRLRNIQIHKRLSGDADKEVIRILSKSAQWTPGEVRGQKVKTKITIHVLFKLPQ